VQIIFYYCLCEPIYYILRSMGRVPTQNKGKTALDIVSLLITFGILIVGLWPFDFNPVNKVEWIPDMNGIRFYGQGIVTSTVQNDFLKPVSDSGAISIEFWIRPEHDNSQYIASIFTLLDRRGEATVLCGQWKSHLIIRSFNDDKKGRARYYEWGLDNSLQRNEVRLLTISSGPQGTDLYLDGVRKHFYSRNLLLTDLRRYPCNLILGNSPTGESYWTGSFLGMAIYDRTLNNGEVLDHFHGWQNRGQPFTSAENQPIALYLFDEHVGRQIRNHSGDRQYLLMPAIFQPLRRTILGVPEKDQWFSRGNLMDVAINMLGFMPFGFFLTSWLRFSKYISAPTAYWIAILLGFCVSLSIELTQAYLPMRDSSLLDVISNTLGTISGILLFMYILSILRKTNRGRMFLPESLQDHLPEHTSFRNPKLH
jgi:hypothetical protein